jgi:hypothetical protein
MAEKPLQEATIKKSNPNRKELDSARLKAFSNRLRDKPAHANLIPKSLLIRRIFLSFGREK